LKFADSQIVSGGSANIWCDVLDARSTEVVARYTAEYYAGKPAITLNRFGKGSAVYVGTFGDQALVQTVVNWALGLVGVTPLLETPERVEATVRWQGDRRLFFLNHNDSEQQVSLDKHAPIISGNTMFGAITVPNEVMILSEMPMSTKPIFLIPGSGLLLAALAALLVGGINVLPVQGEVFMSDGAGSIIPVEPVTLPLSGEWRFAADPDSEGQEQGWHQTNFDDAGWESVTVPHTWNDGGLRFL
jgi:hypothetical protein